MTALARPGIGWVRPSRRLIVALAVLLLFPAAAFPADTDDDTVTTHGGIRFNVPEDWPIEKRGASLGPIPVEQYVSQKLSAMEKRVAALEGKLTSLEQRLQKIEDQSNKGDKLRSKETPAS